ncbi:MAG: carboxypeptidase-like regulatory domain-containing protein [Bacteroidetes bacterium]|nr:carboxypeptidase-like regulatory domain-containing protein [Bacteroidota bacterium]
MLKFRTQNPYVCRIINVLWHPVFSPPLFLLSSYIANAQTKLSGNVKDIKGIAIPGVNVFIKGSYDGTSTDASGNYSFTTTENEEQILSVSFIGFEPQDKKIILVGQDQTVNCTLTEKSNELNTVTITAGSFEASDEKKMVMLRPLDIVTTAGAAGDIYGAIQTLPGAQPQFEQEGLFVRGGDASEAKTFIDGLAVANPYFNSVPDVPQRGRFSPFLLKAPTLALAATQHNMVAPCHRH